MSAITDLTELTKQADSVAGFVAELYPDGDTVSPVWLPIGDDLHSLVARLAGNGHSQKEALQAVGAAVEKIGADLQATAATLR